MTKAWIKISLALAMLSGYSGLSSAQVPSNTQELLNQMSLPLQKTEKESDQVTNYYYKDAAKNELVIGVSNDFIDVNWTFKKSPDENSDINKQAKIVTQKLLGEEWQSLYSAITEGGTVEYLSQDDGTVITDATCSDTMCGYQVKIQ